MKLSTLMSTKYAVIMQRLTSMSPYSAEAGQPVHYNYYLHTCLWRIYIYAYIFTKNLHTFL